MSADTKYLDGVKAVVVDGALSVLSDDLLQIRHEIDKVCVVERVFVPERTCRVESTRYDSIQHAYWHDLSCGHTVISFGASPTAFCGGCGAKVMDE